MLDLRIGIDMADFTRALRLLHRTLRSWPSSLLDVRAEEAQDAMTAVIGGVVV